MAFNLFGWQFVRKEKEEFKEEEQKTAFVTQTTDDGAITLAAGGAMGQAIDLSGVVRTEAELITRYRDMALDQNCDGAIDEIVNESFNVEEEDIVQINMDNVPNISAEIKEKVQDEFQEILNLLNFNQNAYDIYRRWYVDGRLYYNIVIDSKAPLDGIKELRYIDPRKIRKIKEVIKKRIQDVVAEGATLTRTVNEYYVYNEKGFQVGNRIISPGISGLRIAKDTVVMIPSGITDINGQMVLSYLHKAIKPLNQLKSIEDALIIYRLVRAPERRVWYIDVGNLPKIKAEQYVREIMVKHKNKLIYDSSSGQITDSRKFMCFALDTKIPLLDGRTLELNEIIKEYKEGKQNWVYSCDSKTGKFIPGPVSWAGITKRNSEVVRVTLDNGKSVICTPDHKFILRDGSGLIEAQHMVPGTSLMAGYRRKHPINGNGNEYEQIYQNESKKWDFTHRLVAKWKDENNVREEFSFIENNEKKNTIHHKDFDRFNNNPDNLIRMGWNDHMQYHTKFCNSDELKRKNIELHTLIYSQEILELVEQAAKLQMVNFDAVKFINENMNSENWMNINANQILPKRTTVPWKFLYRDLLQVCKQIGYKSWVDYSKQFSNEKTITRYKKITPEFYQKRSQNKEWKKKLSNSRKGKVQHCKTWKITTPFGEQEIIENLTKYCVENNLHRSNIKGDFGSKGYFAEQLHNHKVVSVEWLDEKIDVGCLTIDLEETFHSTHNFLLENGTYAKNTMLEDYWLPRREGGKGTEVTTLQGGENLSQIDDILYFQKKFLQSLNVPVSRLNSDALFSIGRATEITRDELKFDKFIYRLRNKFATGLFTQLLSKQVVLKQIMSKEEFEEIQNFIKYEYSKDTFFTESKDKEILEGRIELATNIQPLVGKYYSQQFMRRQILKQSDMDIEQMDNEMMEEFASQDTRWNNMWLGQIPMDQQMQVEMQNEIGDHQTQNQADLADQQGQNQLSLMDKQMQVADQGANVQDKMLGNLKKHGMVGEPGEPAPGLTTVGPDGMPASAGGADMNIGVGQPGVIGNQGNPGPMGQPLPGMPGPMGQPLPGQGQMPQGQPGMNPPTEDENIPPSKKKKK